MNILERGQSCAEIGIKAEEKTQILQMKTKKRGAGFADHAPRLVQMKKCIKKELSNHFSMKVLNECALSDTDKYFLPIFTTAFCDLSDKLPAMTAYLPSGRMQTMTGSLVSPVRRAAMIRLPDTTAWQ